MARDGQTKEGIVKVEVGLGGRSYPILIGRNLLAAPLPHLPHALPGARFAIVADSAVAAYAGALADALSQAGLLLGNPIFVPSGESSKGFPQLERVCGALLDLGIERNHGVIALGGGVIGDLAGFAAAIVKRGVRLVQMPTTLLAQVDSSVGGKTGIDTRHGKNLIGAFYQPSLVLADLATLETLPPRELRAGYAEVVKYGALGNAAFFTWLEGNSTGVLAPEDAALSHAIETSCRMKAEIVGRDEFETGDRALLNLGHTFGHAIEAWGAYSGQILHGEAVAFGMVLAAEFSLRQGYCGGQAFQRLKAHLEGCGFVTDFQALASQCGNVPTVEQLLAFMEQDKKIRDGQITLILLRDIGDAFVAKNVPRAVIADFLGERLSAVSQ